MLRKVIYLASAVVLALAFLLPETQASAFCGIAAAALFAGGLRSVLGNGSQIKLRDGFMFGALLHAIAFYWLPETVGFFGGFPQPAALAIFALFCVTGALQFLLLSWIYRQFVQRNGDAWLLAFPAAWFISEAVFPRLFPWHLAHTIVSWPFVSGVAAYGGELPLSFLVAWWGSALAALCCGYLQKESAAPVHSRAYALAGVSTLSICALGFFNCQTTAAAISAAPAVKVGLIQGNLAAKQKGNVHYFDVNLQRYRQLSEQALGNGAEVLLWPESVVNRWMNEAQPSIARTALAAVLTFDVPLLYGGLGFRELEQAELDKILAEHPEYRTGEMYDSVRTKRFNSAFLLTPAGDVAGHYHKRVLMPFGEYMPFADVFPIIKSISPMTGDFTKGDLLEPLRTSTAHGEISIGALICYEDLVPSLALDAVRRGANVLVNVTNDAWYGKTAAPYQHHLLAQWRAIETRRYLLRVTNTGFTAVVDPFGRTVHSLPIFAEGTLVAPVHLLTDQTVFAVIGTLPWTVIAWAALVYLLVQNRIASRKKRIAGEKR